MVMPIEESKSRRFTAYSGSIFPINLLGETKLEQILQLGHVSSEDYEH